MGLFVIDSSSPGTVDLEAIALRDVVACAVVLGENGATTDFAVGDRRFDSEGSAMTTIFVPRSEGKALP
jgi:hypothetical protein